MASAIAPSSAPLAESVTPALIEAAKKFGQVRRALDAAGFKDAEVARFLTEVTDWEHREYFEMF